MRKIKKILLMMGFMVYLCACGISESKQNPVEGQDTSVTEYSLEKEDDETKSKKKEKDNDKGLSILCEKDGFGCSTKDGYYYLTAEDVVELKDGNYASHLMYMDFATKQEIYLCNNAGCKHNSVDCSSVYLQNEFTPETTRFFVYEGYLYILSKKPDESGTTSIIYEEEVAIESTPNILYRAELDGTNRKEFYTFDSDVTIEDIVVGGDSGIYLVVKTIKTNESGNKTYSTSEDRKIIYVDFEKKEEKEICSLDFGEEITWEVMGAYDQNLVLSGFDYGSNNSRDDVEEDAYKKADTVYATLDLKNQNLKKVYRINNNTDHTEVVRENMLYVSDDNTNKISSVELTTGKKKKIAKLPQSCIYKIVGDMLCCHSWDWTSDYTFYYVNIATGEVTHSPLVNKCNGWSLDFVAELENQVLVIYDYKATTNNDGSYEIERYQHGLISKEDLYAGNDKYEKITMIGKGK